MNNIHERGPFLPDDFARLKDKRKANARRLDEAVGPSILEYVRSGGGVVGIHAAIAACENRPEYGDMTGTAMCLAIKTREPMITREDNEYIVRLDI